MQASIVLPLVDELVVLLLDEVLPPPGVWLDEFWLGVDLLPQAASATTATTAQLAASPVCNGRNTVILSTLSRCLTCETVFQHSVRPTVPCGIGWQS
jgi:hypothetical protein